MTLNTETPSVDFLILADHAEVLNNRIYMMGGGWDLCRVRDFSQPILLTMAVAVLIPWGATNQSHQLRLRIEDMDGHQLAEIKGDFITGRPPQLSAGTVQRVPLAFQKIPVQLPGPGLYAIVAEVNGRDDKRTAFTATLDSGKSSNPLAA